MARRSTPALVSRRRAAKFPRTGFPSSLPPRPASHPPSTSLPPLAQITSEEEVAKILPLAKAHGVPVTFRAAGTSLSGQVRGFQHRGRGRGGARGGDTNAVARCLRRAGRAGGSGPGQPFRPPPRPRTWPSRRSEAGWGHSRALLPARGPVPRAASLGGGGGGPDLTHQPSYHPLPPNLTSPRSAPPPHTHTHTPQAITDSVLLKLSHTGTAFRRHTVHGDGSRITVEPGLIGGEVNTILARHKVAGGHPVQYKIGPDPSSIDSCMIGGIVSNNSSGMCCGVSQNTYHTLADMRIVFVDGTVLDTADPASVAAFEASHARLLAGISALASRVQGDAQLSALIRRKFAIKCTTGYSLNALVDFPADRPVEIVKRLMIGSEGTFGFVSRATYNTVPEWPHKASAFVMFPDVHSACSAASVLRDQTAVDAVEMFDRPSLKQCEREEAMLALVPDMAGADPRAAALLIECRGETPEALQDRIAEVQRALRGAGLPFGATAAEPKGLEAYDFKHEARDYKVYWDVRKGLIPIVGGAREPGTSMLIEDVACPVDRLADMTVDLADMFARFGYPDASCFGHALEGNLHLVFAQGFRTPAEVQRFADMMEEMCYIVATKHRGSLKGEHGTGRNVAPFVEMEWGTKVGRARRRREGGEGGGEGGTRRPLPPSPRSSHPPRLTSLPHPHPPPTPPPPTPTPLRRPTS